HTELAEGDALASYRSEKGIEVREQRWITNELTDTAIVFHFFATFMDINMPCLYPHRDSRGQATECTHRPFSDDFVLTPETPRSGEGLANDVCLSKVRAGTDGRESFNVYVRRVESASKSKWRPYLPVQAGHNNVFHAIALFVHYIHREHGGVLRTTDLGGIIKLDQILKV
ncbi:hypothetical protein SARC_13622, partial [Sphaeroforma arctica JP610]